MSVQEYLEKHELQKKLEDVLNLCVKDKPEEPLEFMVRRRPAGCTCGVPQLAPRQPLMRAAAAHWRRSPRRPSI